MAESERPPLSGQKPAAEPADTSPRAALPPGLDLLWGRREAGSRGPRRGLSVSDVVAAAIRVADTEGLETLSMARVAKELGFTTMSLYRYVTSKEELLQLMWNDSAQGAGELILEGETWRERLRSWAIIQRRLIDQHPWITRMPMAAPPLAPNSLAFVEKGLEALDGSGLADADKLRVIGLLSSYTLSEARMADDAARAAAEAAQAGGDAKATWTYEALLRELADADRFPRLHRLAWNAEVGDAPSGYDEWLEFLFGVDRILDGVQALIEEVKDE
ncbi:MAG TPA: TetR/AcrR family transcriptional regulator [Streptosporangiaceae bacterium]|jgi:AcrR family transcriptional regulator